MLESNVIPFVKKKDIKLMTNEELTLEAQRLEKLAEVYAATDRVALDRVINDLHQVDSLLLDRYNTENEQWLQNHNL